VRVNQFGEDQLTVAALGAMSAPGLWIQFAEKLSDLPEPVGVGDSIGWVVVRADALHRPSCRFDVTDGDLQVGRESGVG
jgi:hypothetical protein